MDLKSCENGRYNIGEKKGIFKKVKHRKNKRNEKEKIFLCEEKEKKMNEKEDQKKGEKN